MFDDTQNNGPRGGLGNASFPEAASWLEPPPIKLSAGREPVQAAQAQRLQARSTSAPVAAQPAREPALKQSKPVAPARTESMPAFPSMRSEALGVSAASANKCAAKGEKFEFKGPAPPERSSALKPGN